MKKVVAIVGMPGAGKTEAASVFVRHGFFFIRLGQLTLDEVARRGLEPGEATERPIREELRKKYDMDAFAHLNFPKIDAMRQERSVAVDGLYSWEEYLAFRKKYGKNFFVVAVYASPRTRYRRLEKQKSDKKDVKMVRRHYTKEEAASRDRSQLENLHTGGPIAMADFTIINEGSKKDLITNVEKIMKLIK